MDKWVHVNCAVWSAEVYEEHSGLLGMVHTAINRGAQLVREGEREGEREREVINRRACIVII